MKVTVIEDAHVLIPNKNHKNFTTSGQIVEAGVVLEGEPRQIRGLRKGKPFTYRLFVTKQGHNIYINKIKPMRTTEVTLGADAQVSETTINMTNAGSGSNKKYIGAIAGGLSGFAYCRYKKHSPKTTVAYILAGTLAGFGIGYYLEGGSDRIKINQSK